MNAILSEIRKMWSARCPTILPRRLATSGAALVAMVLVNGMLGFWSGEASAAPKFARTSGTWGTNGNWSSASCAAAGATTFPTAADDVTICNGITISVEAATTRAANSVAIATGATATGLTFAAGTSVLNVTNAVVVNLPTGAVTKQINVGAGTLTVGSDLTLNGGTAANRDALLTVSTGLVTINGGLIINATVATSSTASITNAAGRITVNGAAGVVNRDVVSVGAGTFNVTNAAATFTTSDPAIVSVTSVTTGTLAIAGNAVVDSGAIGASSMTVTSGVITVGGNLGVTAAAAGASNTGDATVSVTTGRITVSGNVTVTGGTTNAQDALLTVTGAGAVGQGINIGGTLNIASTVAGSATVSSTNATGRITVSGAGGVNNEDTLTVGVGLVSITNPAATLTTSDPAIVSVTSVTTGTLAIAGNAVVDSGAIGASSMTLTTGIITVGGNLGVTSAAATNDNGDAVVSVTTGRITVAGDATVAGGSNANRDAVLTVAGAGAVGQGVNIGGTLNIVSTVAGSATVSSTNATGRITVNGAGGVNNEDTLTVGVGLVSLTNPAATLTTSDPTIVSVTSVTTGTLAIAGNAVVASGAIGASSMTLTTGVITVGGNLSVTAAPAGADATGDATVSVTTGRITVTGNTTVTGGVVAGQIATLTVTGAGAVGQGVNIGGTLNIASTVAGTATVSSATTATSRITVNGAGGVNNEDTLTVGAGLFSITNPAATLTTSDPAIVSVTSVTTGTLAIAGNAVVDSGAIGASSMTVTTGVITVGGNLGVTSAAATNDNGDATVSVTTGRIDVTGNATVTGGSNNARDALLTVTGAGAVGQGVNIGGTLNIVATVAGSATVAPTVANARITVGGAGGVNNGDTLTVGAGTFSITNPAATLNNSSATVVATTTVSTGTLAILGGLNNGVGETMTFTGGSVLVAGPFTSNGTLTASGTVTLNGATAQTISGLNPITFTNLTVTNAASPNITLATNVVVSATLTGTVTLTSTCPVDYTLTSAIPAQILHSCVPTAVNFNACSNGDTCPTITARLYTRIANRAFALYLAALKADGSVEASFSGSATVSLVGRIAAGGPVDAANCPTGAVDLTQALGSLAFVSGKRTQTGITIANVYRDMRVRFVCDSTNCPPAGVTACSSDNFAVRPDDLGLSATITSPLKAGDTVNGDTFGLSTVARANAVNATNYNGTPLVNAGLVTAVAGSIPVLGTLDGAFGAAVAGTASGTFGYSEVGYFDIAAQGAYDVAFVTAADAAGTDCTNDFNNTYVAATPGSTVGCRFGNLVASGNIGRFTPDKFVSLVAGVIPSVTPFCGSGAAGFTYAGQSALHLKVTLEAQNKAGVRTRNYDDSYTNGKGLVEFLAENSDDDVNLGGRLDHAVTPLPPWPTWLAGQFVVDKPGSFVRGASPDGPFDSLEIGVRVTRASTADGDDDGIKVSPEDMVVAGRNGLKLPGTTRVRHGILKLDNTYGTELLNLRVPMRTLYLATAPAQFVVNTLDSCTTLAAANVAFGNFKGSLVSLTVNGINQISAGQGSIVLTKPSLIGSADMAVNLGSTATDASCNTSHPVTTGADKSWLRGKWCGSNYDKDPNARVRFGVSKAPYIYLRERY